MNNFNTRHLWWIVPAAIVVFLVGGALNFRNQRNVKQNLLNAQYVSNQNSLSTLISTFFEEVGLAQAGGDQYFQGLEDAFKGKYGEDGFSTDGAFFVAISEDYPDPQALLANWGKIQDHMVAGRKDYKGDQDKLLDMLQDLETFCTTGTLRPIYAGLMGCPSDGLVARIAGANLYGRSAMEKMWNIVLTDAAVDAYEGGTMDPLQVPTRQPEE